MRTDLRAGGKEVVEYLSIKNWDKYQSSYSREWIKDYTGQDEDDKICKLTLLQRQVLAGLRRVRGRSGKNTPNDVTYISQAIHAMPTDRPHIAHAIATLISREFLILTNQQDDTPKIHRVEKRRIEKKREEKPSATPQEILPQDSRHKRIQALVTNCYQEHNKGVACPWDGGEGKQLQSLLRSTPSWADTQIAQCLGNMYDSAGFAKGSRPREWLTRLPKYLNGPLNEFNQEKAPYVSKAQQRQDASNDAIRTALTRITGKDGGLVESGLSLPGNDTGNGGIVLEGDGSSGLRSRKASAGSSS
jgi:hypothetical protein